MKFKFGDMVRILQHGSYSGLRGRVTSVNAHMTAPYPYGVKVFIGGSPKYVHLAEDEIELWSTDVETSSKVDHPSHYTWLPNGLEVIDLTECLNFNRGNSVKYLCRAGKKDPATELEDLKKARWYVEREIARVEKESKSA